MIAFFGEEGTLARSVLGTALVSAACANSVLSESFSFTYLFGLGLALLATEPRFDLLNLSCPSFGANFFSFYSTITTSAPFSDYGIPEV